MTDPVPSAPSDLSVSPAALAAFPSGPELRVTVVRDEAGLRALRPAWESLEAQAEAGGLYVTWGYASRAWQFLATPGDGLWVMAVHEEVQAAGGEAGGERRLVGVLPLVRVVERHHGMTVQVLRHLGIWEGDRPDLLALREVEVDRVWTALWQALVAQRSSWHVLDLRELEAGAWPLRALRCPPGRGFAGEVRPDIVAPFQALTGDGARSDAGDQCPPGLRVVVAQSPHDILDALDRYLRLEMALWQAGDGLTLLGQDPRRVALYRDWLPVLAARGEAAVWLLREGDGSGVDLAGLIRLRRGGVWIERHACHDPARTDEQPSLHLTVEALRFSADTGAAECRVVNAGEPTAGGPVPDLFEGRCQTHRLTVWNAWSRLAPRVVLGRLKRLFR